MARKKALQDAPETRQKKKSVSSREKKRDAESSEETIAKKLRKKKEGETSEKTEFEVLATGKLLDIKKDKQTSIVHYIYKNSLGHNIQSQMRQCLQEPFLRLLRSYHLFRTASPFDRRVTCLEWHPTHPSTLAAGSKGGDIVLWDYRDQQKPTFIQGTGAGGSITDMKFNPFNPNQLFTSSIMGTTTLQDFNGSTLKVYARTELWE